MDYKYGQPFVFSSYFRLMFLVRTLYRQWYLIVFLTMLSPAILIAQQYTPDRFFVQFSDKQQTVYDIQKPEDFLSLRALERRERMNISVDERDLPVSPHYLDSLTNIGAEIHGVTKWLNGAVIAMDSMPLLSSIAALPFVRSVDIVRYQQKDSFGGNKKEGHAIAVNKKVGSNDFDEAYGFSENQIALMNLHHLHSDGYQGEGIMVAVLDAGFSYVDQMVSLRHLIQSNRLVATRDFVDGDYDVYHGSTHGMAVLSIMAAHIPETYIGAATKASYLLLRTEDVASEYPIEELNWAAAAEYADSLGADLINSSLGYSSFDHASLSYQRHDLDGNTAYSTIAADIAASRGMLVVNSAGNEGNSSWQYISAPADGDSVLTAAAVDQKGIYASFSSKGPAADGDQKPNVAAVGKNTFFVNGSDQVLAGNGTSFSAPLLSAACASLWSAFPEISHMDLKDAVERSSSRFQNPDTLTGYGIPDFQMAAILLQHQQQKQQQALSVLPNPFHDKLYLFFDIQTGSDARFELYDIRGRLIQRLKPRSSGDGSLFIFSGLDKLNQGTYILRVSSSAISQSVKVVKI
ncbi:MAG: S8 family peptidase [Bacteroidales bacterium]